MTRLVSLLILMAFGSAAVLASDNAKPISPGIRDNAIVWLQICNPIARSITPGVQQKNRGVHQV